MRLIVQTSRGSRAWRALVCLMVLSLGSVARGQVAEREALLVAQAADRPLLVAGGDPVIDKSSTSGHGWVFVPGKGGGDGFLVHAVPRQGVQRASAGSVRLVMALKKAPLAMSAWDGEVLMLAGPRGDDATRPLTRTLSSVKASGPVSLGNWVYRPSDRLELRGSLPADTVPRSLVGSSLGPVVVWERVVPGGTVSELEVAVLDDGSDWRVLQPPAGFPRSSAGEAHALATQSGVMLATRAPGGEVLELWKATPMLSGVSAGVLLPVLTRWESAGVARLPAEFRGRPLRTMGAGADSWLLRDGGHTLLGSRTGAGLALWRLGASEAERLWHTDDARGMVGSLVSGGVGAVTFLMYDAKEPEKPLPKGTATGDAGSGRDAPPAAPEAGRLRVVEVSSSTGAVLADLPAHTDGFLSRGELQVLWLLFIGVGVVILLVVLRIDGPQEIQLPEGTSLASPIRRVIAGGLDVLLAVGLASMVAGGSPSQWLSPATSASSSLVPLLSVIGFGWLLGTLGEATLGCSPGKLLVGVRVMGLVANGERPAGRAKGDAATAPTVWRAERPRFYQALLRNMVRWFMPPMGMMMIVDNNWRHPGDLLGRTVVVVRFTPEVGPAEDDGDDQ